MKNTSTELMIVSVTSWSVAACFLAMLVWTFPATFRSKVKPPVYNKTFDEVMMLRRSIK